jgi:cytidyltransferase-like protein
MQLYVDQFPFLPTLKSPVGLTIGTFDGLHLGHAYLINRLIQENATSIVITFSNPPYNYFHPNAPKSLLTTLEEKLHLLEKNKIDIVCVLHFDQKIASTPYEDFLILLHQKCHFSSLYLGKDSHLGFDKQGNEKAIQKVADQLGFNLKILSCFSEKEEKVSSSRIREAIENKEFSLAKRFLGRPFSYSFENFSEYDFFLRDHEYVGLLPLEKLVIPPSGKYLVSHQIQQIQWNQEIKIYKEQKLIEVKIPINLMHKNQTLTIFLH